MKRRDTTGPAAVEVPEELAEGRRVSRWAHQVVLDRIARISPEDVGFREAMESAQLSAAERYRAAFRRWELDTGGPTQASRRLFWKRVYPYFDPPETPLPDRVGYAAEPEVSRRAKRNRPSSGAES